MSLALPDAVTLIEVGPRDGLQNEAETLTVAEKVELIHRLQAANVKEIEIGSFVSPRAVPQMAGTAEVFAAIEKRPDVIYHALVPNQRGYDDAKAAGIRHVRLVVAASEPLHQANFRKTIAESLEEHASIIEQAKRDGLEVEAVIGGAWGDPFIGPTPIEDVLRCARHYYACGIRNITVADTVGMATPRQVDDLIGALQREFPDAVLGTHFHDTRGTGLANVLTALQLGITRFDAAVGGTGGCPFAPKAGGNICSEDMIHMLYGMKVESGVNLDRMVETALWVEEKLKRPLAGKMMKADPVYPVFRTSQPVPVKVGRG